MNVCDFTRHVIDTYSELQRRLDLDRQEDDLVSGSTTQPGSDNEASLRRSRKLRDCDPPDGLLPLFI